MKKNNVFFTCFLSLYGLVIFFGCTSKESDTKKNEKIISVNSELEFLMIRLSSLTNNSCEIFVDLPQIIDSTPDKIYIISNKHLMLNKTIEILDSNLNNYFEQGKSYNSDDYRGLFNKYFNDTLYDWTVNIMLKKYFDNDSIDLNFCVPNRVDFWRKNCKSDHRNSWINQFGNASHDR